MLFNLIACIGVFLVSEVEFYLATLIVANASQGASAAIFAVTLVLVAAELFVTGKFIMKTGKKQKFDFNYFAPVFVVPVIQASVMLVVLCVWLVKIIGGANVTGSVLLNEFMGNLPLIGFCSEVFESTSAVCTFVIPVLFAFVFVPAFTVLGYLTNVNIDVKTNNN